MHESTRILHGVVSDYNIISATSGTLISDLVMLHGHMLLDAIGIIVIATLILVALRLNMSTQQN